MNAVDAWQAVLESEYAALYGYGIVGARTRTDEEGGVRAAMTAHPKYATAQSKPWSPSVQLPRRPQPAYSTPVPR